MLTVVWLTRVLARRPARLGGAVLGVGLTVAFLAALGAFVTSSAAVMTRRAVADVPVDWQVQLAPGADPQAVTQAVINATAPSGLEQVEYADTPGFTATTGGTVQTTGPGKVLGLGPNYRLQFPAELRLLTGTLDGVLVAQQTAANLHAAPGDAVTVQRVGLPPVTVILDGVVDLPYADSLFQVVGAPAGAAPTAPPDNVFILPADQWHALFDAQATARPDSVRTQLHVRIAHALPSDPGAAYAAVQRLARHVEAQTSGSALVGENLAARLDGVRADALYARVLFLFLGLPGTALAVILTLAVASAGGEPRRREQALLRTRGASTAEIVRLESMEAMVVAAGGVAVGLVLAVLASRVLLAVGTLARGSVVTWMAVAVLVGAALAVGAVLVPAWRLARATSVVAARAPVGRAGAPLWQRVYLDVALLAAAALAFWQTASTGYQVVLAPEGVPQTAVSYQAFIAPLCLWLGASLVVMRLCRGALARGRRPLGWLLRPVARGLADVVAASLGRERTRVARGVVLVALAVAFATSTAVFNATYAAQARIDAQLTNGADVTVSSSTASPAGAKLAELQALPGVAAAQPMQHRFAYVGNDLQDLYGIDPARIAEATAMSNAYFAGGNARATLTALAATPDGVLVSEETVKDFQLMLGDHLNLRLQDARDHQYHTVPFRFVGVVREFPTAPKDSFLVANASYIAQQTGTDAAEVVLLRARGNSADLAARARSVLELPAGLRVTDLGSAQRTIGSGLTAVNLHGLTRLELAFAVLLVTGASGLILGLGLAERRRTFTILTALGARPGQLGAFLWGEGLVVAVGGGLSGLMIGLAVAQVLVKLLTGVFDPPPDALAVPWRYLLLVVAAATVSTILAVLSTRTIARGQIGETLRSG